MALLDAIQDACAELSITQPQTAVGNTDTQVIQLVALANREGKEMASNAGPNSGLTILRKQYTFQLVPAAGGVGGVYTGTTTRGSNVISGIADTTGVLQGYGVSGGSILTGAMVTGVAANAVTLDTPASTTAAGQTFSFGQVAYDLPDDIAFFISATYWDRNFRWQMLGPLSAQEWQTIISGISPVGPRLRFRLMAGQMNIQPPPGVAQTDTIVYEYITENWCRGAADSTLTQNAWEADADVYAFPQDLLTLGVKWRFLRAKGLDYGEEFQTWQRAVERYMAREGGNRDLPLNAQGGGLNLLGNQNIPDTGFGR